MGNLSLNEQIYLLAIWHLRENAYGVVIRDKITEISGKSMVFGTLYNNLDALVRKGYVTAKRSDSKEYKTGNKKVFYTLTDDGRQSLADTKKLQESLWNTVPGGVFTA